MTEEIHKGDIGTVFEVTMYDELGGIVDLSDAGVMEIKWQRRNGADPLVTVTNTAVWKTDGTDGKMQYTTTTVAELDYVGKWFRQGYAEKPSGQWNSDIQEFEVHENL